MGRTKKNGNKEAAAPAPTTSALTLAVAPVTARDNASAVTSTSPKLAAAAAAAEGEEEGCRHLAQSQTECGHTECLSPDEIKANTARQTLTFVSFFCFAFMCAELVGGYVSGSLAIMTDAAHLLSDLASFLISIVSLYVSRKGATSSLSFGFHRAEILGAILSVLLIWCLTGALLYEAFGRFSNPVPIDGRVMLVVATLGLVVNVVMGMILLKSGHGHSHGGLPGGAGHGHSHGGDDHHHDEHSEDDHGHGGSDSDEEAGHGHAHGGDDHGHGHGHDHDHGHGHGSSEKAALLGNAGAHRYGASEGSDHDDHSHDDDHDDHGHGHGHGGSNAHASGAGRSGSSKKRRELNWYDRIFANPDHNINVRAALVHVLGDALQSIGVIVAAALICYSPSFAVADPICTVLFSIIVLFTTVRIMREALLVLMEGVPEGISVAAVTQALRGIPGVRKVHDLHIWSLSVGNPALSVHLEVARDALAPAPTSASTASGVLSPVTPAAPGAELLSGGNVLSVAHRILKRRFGITHTTIQIETADDDIACNAHGVKRSCVRA